MADQSDVETALVSLAAAALYPNGPTSTSVPGPDCRIYRGWPNSATLDSDLNVGKINVTVFPATEPAHNTTRYLQSRHSLTVSPTFAWSRSGNSVTITGGPGPQQLIGVAANGRSYIYRSQTTDTPEIVAANLAAALQSDWIVSLAGATITVFGAGPLLTRVVATAPATQEVRRQNQAFKICCWCPSPAMRDISASAIDAALANSAFIALADGTQGYLRYRSSTVFDQSQDALLYRRDLTYDVEYPTVISESLSTMLFGDLLFNSSTVIA